MKNNLKRIICFLLCFSTAACVLFTNTMAYAASSNTVSVTLKATSCYDEAFKVLKLINKERMAEGKKALKMDKGLLESAMQRAYEISLYFSHTRPNGKDCFTADNDIYAENIAMGQSTPEDATYSWMNSAGHRKNILNGAYKSTGIGCVYVDGSYSWVQVFSYDVNKNVKASSYGNKTKKRTVEVKKDEEYYNAQFAFETKTMKVGQSKAFSVNWYDFASFFGSAIKVGGAVAESTDTSVCVINGTKVKAVGAGTAKIKVYYPGYKKKAKTFKVTVTGKKAVKATKVKLNKSKLNLKVGKSQTLKATVSPKKSTQNSLIWSSSNKKIVTVTSNGKLKAVKKGTATVTVKVEGTNLTAKCKVTVKAKK